MENLGIDLKLLIAQIINFVVFYFLIKKFIAKPFLKFINEEKQKETEKQKLFEATQKQEEEFKNREKALLIRSKKEMDKVLIQAKVAGEKAKEEIIDQAKKGAEEIKNIARKNIEQERKLLYTQIKHKVSDLSLMIVNEFLKEILDEETKKKITQKILNDSSKKVSLYEN